MEKVAQLKGGQIQLLPKEQQIFDLLRKVAEQHGVTLRVAGGWVRDKALGKQSHDIDIAIDKMTGEQFAAVLEPVLGYRAHVIESNPEQSKHLATATVKVFGLPIDFVNLRDETFGGAYSDGDNRILKENRFTTVEIDAQRRDYTVGALFYNIHTNQIEDYVGGLRDLGFDPDGVRRRGITLRTPLPPKKTFMDDPIRILRGMRFLAKMEGSQFAPEVLQAMRDPEVQQALARKVSPERIGAELVGIKEKDENGNPSYKAGIMNGARCEEAVRAMHDTGILDVIFGTKEEGLAPFEMDQRSKHHKLNLLEHTLQHMREQRKSPFFQTLSPEKQSLWLFSGLTHDFGKRSAKAQQQKPDGDYSYHGHEDVSAEVVRKIMNRLRLPSEQIDYVCKVVAGHMAPHADGWGNDKTLRRFMNRYPETWQDIMWHAHSDATATGIDDPKRLGLYQQFVNRGNELLKTDPVSPTNQKPVLSGQIIMSLIPELDPKSGFIRKVNTTLLDMRMENPNLGEADFINKVVQMKPALLTEFAQFRR